MLSLLQLSVRAGRAQDAAALAARTAAAKTASAEMLERQRARYDAFMHDDVLATLLSASRNSAESLDVTRQSARRALQKLDEFRADSTARASLEPGELESLLRSAAFSAGEAVVFRYDEPAEPGLLTPVDVGDALAEALAESLRNSFRHAEWPDGRPVHREVRARVTANGIDIVATDDGRGFESRRIGLDRLGLRVSILQRLNAQPGGRATVSSSRGKGTTVTLGWTSGKPTDET
jgi:signal transduction histidine kinase